MHPADIKAQLEKAGSSQAQVAASVIGRHGVRVSPNAVWMVVAGHSRSAPIARRISEVTGLPVGQLWPGKYPAIEAEQARGRRAPKPAPKRSAHPTR